MTFPFLSYFYLYQFKKIAVQMLKTASTNHSSDISSFSFFYSLFFPLIAIVVKQMSEKYFFMSQRRRGKEIMEIRE